MNFPKNSVRGVDGFFDSAFSALGNVFNSQTFTNILDTAVKAGVNYGLQDAFGSRGGGGGAVVPRSSPPPAAPVNYNSPAAYVPPVDHTGLYIAGGVGALALVLILTRK